MYIENNIINKDELISIINEKIKIFWKTYIWRSIKSKWNNLIYNSLVYYTSFLSNI